MLQSGRLEMDFQVSMDPAHSFRYVPKSPVHVRPQRLEPLKCLKHLSAPITIPVFWRALQHTSKMIVKPPHMVEVYSLLGTNSRNLCSVEEFLPVARKNFRILPTRCFKAVSTWLRSTMVKGNRQWHSIGIAYCNYGPLPRPCVAAVWCWRQQGHHRRYRSP